MILITPPSTSTYHHINQYVFLHNKEIRFHICNARNVGIPRSISNWMECTPKIQENNKKGQIFFVCIHIRAESEGVCTI